LKQVVYFPEIEQAVVTVAVLIQSRRIKTVCETTNLKSNFIF